MHYEKIKNVKKLLINAIKLLIIELQMLDLIFNSPIILNIKPHNNQ